ncbi:MAG: TonB-dependent receptor [Bacteroidales bacterium]|nr:TonB-dependent receptor [Bacteroidales bacterium]
MFKRLITLLAGILIAAGTVAYAQQEKVSGKVTDSAGEPVPGASVFVKGTNNGTVTDIVGAFSLRNVSRGDVLAFSCIGYESVEVTYNGQTLAIILNDDNQMIEETVVVGYATMKKRDLVGAVDAVGSEVFGNRAASNLTRALQGEIAGLNITFNDSKPSHGGSYNVRGTGSIGAGGGSLVLIDGVEGSMSMVNPQDVESVSVLKDASSTAVYGARGAFGVILITTKNAKKGRPTVNYNGSFIVNRRTVIPDDIYDSNDWLDIWMAVYDGYYNGSKARLNHLDNKAPYSEAIYNEIIRRKADPTLPKVEENYDVSGFGYAYYDCHDWLSEFYRDYHYSTEHNLSVSGGGENADYYVSGRFYDSQGVFRVGNEDFKKYNLRMKGTLKIRPWMKLTNNASVSVNNTYLPRQQAGQSVMRIMEHWANPMVPLKNPDGSWTPAAVGTGYAAYAEGNNYLTDNYIYLRDKISLDIDIIKDVLKIQADYSYNYTDRQRAIVQHMVQYSKSPGVYVWESETQGEKLQKIDYHTVYQTANIYASWTPKLGKNHSLTLLGGYNVEDSNYVTLNASRVGFTSATKPSFALMDGEATVTQGGNSWGVQGYFFRVNYSLLDRYLFEISGRYDGSSKFPTYSQWGFFPSGSVAWRLSDEPFMAWIRPVVDNLKIRGSYGSIGNGSVSPYSFTSEISLSKATDFVLDGALPTVSSSASTVPDSLTWETATTADIGLDIDLLKSRLSGTFDIYRRITSDMYTAGATLPGVYGASVPKGNNAELKTDGWEMSIQWRDQFNLGGKPFSYSVKGTLWDSRTWVTKFNGNDAKKLGTIANLIANMGQPDYYEGMELGEMWGYTVVGLYKDWDDVANSATQNFKQTVNNAVYPGQVKFADLDLSGEIDYLGLSVEDHGDLSIIGNSLPRYRYGLNLNASWNGIGLNVFFQGVGKRDWYPGYDSGYFWGRYARPFFYFTPTIHKLDNPYVAQFDDEGNCINWDTAYWPRPTTYQSNSQDKKTVLSTPNTRYKQNAAYLRMKNIEISYTFNRNVCQALGLEDLKVFINGENLFTYTPLHKWAPNLDPEGIDGGDTDFSSNTLNGTAYPTFKSVAIGLNVTF